jgi:hypothetical protein
MTEILKKKLWRIVRESDSYEEFLIKARSDEETSDLLEKLSAQWAKMYKVCKENRLAFPGGETASASGLYRAMKRVTDNAEVTDGSGIS